MATSGTLNITLVEARFEKDVEVFGTQDPFVEMEYRMQKQKSKTHTDGGKNPQWLESFDFQIKYVGDDM